MVVFLVQSIISIQVFLVKVIFSMCVMFFSEGFLKHDFHGVFFFAHLHEEPPSARESVIIWWVWSWLYPFFFAMPVYQQKIPVISYLYNMYQCVFIVEIAMLWIITSYVYRYTHKVAPLAREWSGSVEARAEARAMLLWFKAAKLQLNYCFFKMVLTLPCAKLPV
jgi:hypothetical protein